MPDRQVVVDGLVRQAVEEFLNEVGIPIRCRGKDCGHEVVINREQVESVAEKMTSYGWGVHEGRLLCPRCLFRAVGHYRVDICAACDQPLQSDEVGPFGGNCARSLDGLDLSRDLRKPHPPAWRTRSQIEIRRNAAHEAWKTRRARERG